MYSGLQKYSFINIMIYYKHIQNNAQFQRHKIFLINENNLSESAGRGRKKHAIIRDINSLRYQSIRNNYFPVTMNPNVTQTQDI